MFLRFATQADYPLIMAWRSNPLIYSGFYSQKEPLKWQEHIAWFASRPSSWRTFIICLVEDSVERPIGGVTIGQLEYWEFEIGIYIGEVSLWGKGYGKRAVELALEYGKSEGKDYCRTTILDNNKRSIDMFTSLGFIRIADARNNESLYRKTL